MPNILTEFAEFQQHTREHGPSTSLLDDTQNSDIFNFSQHSPSMVDLLSFPLFAECSDRITVHLLKIVVLFLQK